MLTRTDPPPLRRPDLTIGDYEFRGRTATLKQTGHSARIGYSLFAEVARWFLFYLIVIARMWWVRLTRARRATIRFTPSTPHPRYLVRSAAMWAGFRIARGTPHAPADVAFFFEDATVCMVTAPGAHGFNSGCCDISKSRVAAVFGEIFGYPLALDPALWIGEAVEKSETNGAHDGRIVICPREAMPGRTYQRAIDTVRADGFAYDLRTHCIDGVPVIVWSKCRDPARRFAPPSVAVTRHLPDAVFSASELASIARFCGAMHADWCGLDILRDADGRIYIVDVNKTDAGPINALSLGDKLASTAILANALGAMVDRPHEPACNASALTGAEEPEAA